jgi:hypothetical protein
MEEITNNKIFNANIQRDLQKIDPYNRNLIRDIVKKLSKSDDNELIEKLISMTNGQMKTGNNILSSKTSDLEYLHKIVDKQDKIKESIIMVKKEIERMKREKDEINNTNKNINNILKKMMNETLNPEKINNKNTNQSFVNKIEELKKSDIQKLLEELFGENYVQTILDNIYNSKTNSKPSYFSNFFNDEGNNKHRLTTIFDTFDNNFNFSELMKREDIQRKSKEIIPLFSKKVTDFSKKINEIFVIGKYDINELNEIKNYNEMIGILGDLVSTIQNLSLIQNTEESRISIAILTQCLIYSKDSMYPKIKESILNLVEILTWFENDQSEVYKKLTIIKEEFKRNFVKPYLGILFLVEQGKIITK